LTTKAKEMVEQIKAGTAMNEVARKAGLKVETTFGMKRNATKPLTANAVAEVFRTPKGSVGYGDGQNANERVIFRVTEVNEPAFDASSQDAKKYFETWRRALAEELLTQYVQRLETDIGTKINQEAVARAFGGDQS
jgi:peptidyl-prolyl cis-trans isomerase D